MKKITRIDLENILTHIPDEKLHSLKLFLEKKKILKPNDIFTIKSKLKLTSEEFTYVKKILEKVSDMEASLMKFALLFNNASFIASSIRGVPVGKIIIIYTLSSPLIEPID